MTPDEFREKIDQEFERWNTEVEKLVKRRDDLIGIVKEEFAKNIYEGDRIHRRTVIDLEIEFIESKKEEIVDI